MLTQQEILQARQKLGINKNGVQSKSLVGDGLLNKLKTETPKQDEGVFSRIRTGIEERGEKVQEVIVGEGQFEDRSILGRGVGATAETFGALSGTVYNSLGEGARNTLDKIGGGIGKGVEYLAERLAFGGALSPFIQKLAGEQTTNPDGTVSYTPNLEGTKKLEEGLTILADLGMISGEIIGGREVVKGINAVPVIAKKGVDVAVKAGAKVGQVIKPIVKTVKSTTDNIREGLGLLDPKTKARATKTLTEAYDSSFIADKTSINNKLQKIGARFGRTQTELIDDLVERGIAPNEKGALADFTEPKALLKKQSIANRDIIETSVAKYKDLTKLDDIQTIIERGLRESADPTVLDKALKELDRTFKSFKTKYGDDINPTNLDEIRVAVNKKTKAFKSEVFEQDVSNSIGDVVRARLDDIIPEEAFRKANGEIQKFMQLEKTIDVFDNLKINVNEHVKTIGSLAGVLSLGGVGAGALGLVTGAGLAGGGLIIAGLIAKAGANTLIKFVRKHKFNDVAIKIMQETFDIKPTLVDDLLKLATKEEARFINQTLLPAPSTIQLGAKGQSVKAPAQSLTAEKGFVGQDPNTGKFIKTFKSVPEGTTPKPLISAKSITDFIKENGGITVNNSGKTPTKGFVVSPSKTTETIIPIDKFTSKNITDFKKKYSKQLSKENAHLGAWESDGNIVLDVSVVLDNLDEALRIGKKSKQDAVWDIVKGEEVKVETKIK